jgi:hypothetical protein
MDRISVSFCEEDGYYGASTLEWAGGGGVLTHTRWRCVRARPTMVEVNYPAYFSDAVQHLSLAEVKG